MSRLGHNFRLAEPLAAIGRRELARLDALIAHRIGQTTLLLDLLADLPQLRPADLPAGQRWNHYAPLLHLQLEAPGSSASTWPTKASPTAPDPSA